MQIAQHLGQTDSAWLNMPINELRRKLAGDPRLGSLTAALGAAKEEWLNFLKSQHAPNQEEVAMADSILNPNFNLNYLSGVLQTMGNQAVDRLGTLNGQWTGAGFAGTAPGLVANDTYADSKYLGVQDRLKQYTLDSVVPGIMLKLSTQPTTTIPTMNMGTPQATVTVQIPGFPAKPIAQSQLDNFMKKYPNAKVINQAGQ